MEVATNSVFIEFQNRFVICFYRIGRTFSGII